MAAQPVSDIVQSYLRVLRQEGMPVDFAVLFGSQARGEATEWSDIDLLVVSPLFDGVKTRDDIDLLWTATSRADVRIEPVPVGTRQWLEDETTPLIEEARRDGQIIRLAESDNLAA
ncbi:MAG: nucleotidyltransferase domain-containing protein [Magnetococcales bacterium]|nr:nucleotidyltransferase domain-containing protein [Magnetococcales bacterium]